MSPERAWRRLVGAGLLVFGMAVSACNLAPVYAGGANSAPASLFAQIAVAPIPERQGFLVRQALIDRLGPPNNARYRLEVALDDQIVAFGVRGDNSAARERRTLRARYRLVEVGTDTVLLDASAGSDIGIDRVSSNYAVVAAETTALERLSTELATQITARLAQFARQTPTQ